VLRHAAATEVLVRLEREEGRVVLSVRDDGRGLPPGANGGGLRGLRERAMVIDAQLEVGGGADRGTEVILRVPVP
jgi:two-component system sensor histidine kinase UhpB